VLEELEYGRGFILVTGLPIEDVQQAEWILCAFAGEIGIPVSQNQRGDFIGRVEDKGADITKATARGYQSSASLPFHSDRADLTALLCVRAAECGGETFLVSAVAAMEELASSSPDLLEILEKPFPHDQRGEQRPGQGPWTMHPVFVRDRNTFLARYIRRFIDASQRHIGAPSLTVRQYQALDALDGVLNRHDLPITVRLQPGDLLLMNNHLIFHGRTVFQDSVIPGNGRLLFRIWLASHLGRPLPPSFEEVFGSTESGDVRGGVWPPDTNVSAIYKRLSKT
jgi:alpha-ketoglutarate-dependent taurine dioxygenase